MTRISRMLARALPLILIAVALLAVAAVGSAFADEESDAAYQYWFDTYSDWTLEDVEAAGYEVDPMCVTAEMEGLDPELGAMGHHAVNAELYGKDLVVEKPHIILLDGDYKVVGVEYEWPEVVDPAPTIAGMPLVFTPPHPGVDHDHLSLHVFFVGDAGERFGTWNTAVTCPAQEATAADESSTVSATGTTEGSPPEYLPTTGVAGSPLASLPIYAGLLLSALGLAGVFASRRANRR